MTREEAIEFGNMWLQINEDCKDSSTYAFFQMAIKALEQEPPKQDCNNCKHYADDNETCLECEYEGITRGYTRYEQEPSGDLISRQAVQDYIAKYLSQYLYNDVREAVEVIDEYIGELPSVNPQPCDNAIRAEIKQKCDRINSIASVLPYTAHREIQELLCEIMDLPSVKQEPKTGHWIMTNDYLTTAYGSIDYVKCSCCGEDSLEEGEYCPHCGAKMVE